MLNVLLVIFGGLGLYLFFLTGEPEVEVLVDNRELVELTAKIAELRLKEKDLVARHVSLTSVKDVFANRIKALQVELEEAKKRKTLEMGTGAAFFENKIRQEKKAAMPTVNNLQAVVDEMAQIEAQIKKLGAQLKQIQESKERAAGTN